MTGWFLVADLFVTVIAIFAYRVIINGHTHYIQGKRYIGTETDAPRDICLGIVLLGTLVLGYLIRSLK